MKVEVVGVSDSGIFLHFPHSSSYFQLPRFRLNLDFVGCPPLQPVEYTLHLKVVTGSTRSYSSPVTFFRCFPTFTIAIRVCWILVLLVTVDGEYIVGKQSFANRPYPGGIGQAGSLDASQSE